MEWFGGSSGLPLPPLVTPGLPESFNVLVKELQSLALDINLMKDEQEFGYDGVEQDV